MKLILSSKYSPLLAALLDNLYSHGQHSDALQSTSTKFNMLLNFVHFKSYHAHTPFFTKSIGCPKQFCKQYTFYCTSLYADKKKSAYYHLKGPWFGERKPSQLCEGRFFHIWLRFSGLFFPAPYQSNRHIGKYLSLVFL